MSRKIEVNPHDGVPSTGSVLGIFEKLEASQLVELATILQDEDMLDLEPVPTDSKDPGRMRKIFRALALLVVKPKTEEEEFLRVVVERRELIKMAVLDVVVNGSKPDSKLPAHVVNAVRDAMDCFAQSMSSEEYERRLREV